MADESEGSWSDFADQEAAENNPDVAEPRVVAYCVNCGDELPMKEVPASNRGARFTIVPVCRCRSDAPILVQLLSERRPENPTNDR